MFFTYIYRHGWRHSFLAFFNFLLWFSVLLQLGGLIAMGSSRPIYSQLSADMGFDEGTLMGSILLEKLLGSAGLWGLALIALVVVAKEFTKLTVSHRLMINGALLLICSGLVAYVVTTLHYLPVQ